MSALDIPTARAFVPLLQPSRYKGAFGGRASAKSHFFAELAIERSVMAPTDIVCVREIQRTLDQSVKKLLESKIRSLNAGSYFDVQDRRIRSRPANADDYSGMIIFEGMQDHTADSVKSMEGFDVAYVEEAQKLSQRSLDLLRPTIRKPGSELWFAWNPERETDPVDVLFRGESQPPQALSVRVSYRDNPWLPDVMLQELQYDQKRDPDKFAHIWMGEYQRNSESRVFKNWTIEEFDSDRNAIIRQGADWGFSIDPTVLVQCYIIGRKLYVPHEAYRIGCEIVDIPSLFLSLPEAEKWPLIADSARPETISHVRKNGFPKITAAIKGPKSLEEGVEFLKSFDIVVHPRCKHTIDELTLYSYEIDKMTGAVLPRLADKDNHVIDALRYACEGARRAGVNRPVVERKSLARPQYGESAWMA